MRQLRTQRPIVPILLAFSIGSGCAALIYAVVWFQLLDLVIGSPWVSLDVLLGSLAAGVCIGSILLPRLVSNKEHPLKVYAFLEFALGVAGIGILYAMPFIAFMSWGKIVAGICLLLPSVLMGATLPAIARWFTAIEQRTTEIGLFLTGYIAGAVAGSLLAGFYLLRIYDVTVATFAALALHCGIAIIAMAVAKSAHYQPPATDGAVPVRRFISIHVSTALTGMTALVAGVIWTRHLSLLLGGTVYTFSLMLAVFLLGIGIGSSAGAVIARWLKRPQWVLGLCQVLLCAAIAWTAYVVTRSLPYWPINPSLTRDPWISFQLDVFRLFLALLPATCLWGLTLSLALAAVPRDGPDAAWVVGRMYASSAGGAGTGILVTTLVPWIGSQHAQQGLILVSAATGLLMWWTAGRRPRLQFSNAAVALLVAVVASLLALSVPTISAELIAFGRFLPERGRSSEVIYARETLHSSVAVTREVNGLLSYHNNGQLQVLSAHDMRSQRVLGHLTTLAAHNSQSFLVIGCGAGVTAGAV